MRIFARRSRARSGTATRRKWVRARDDRCVRGTNGRWRSRIRAEKCAGAGARMVRWTTTRARVRGMEDVNVVGGDARGTRRLTEAPGMIFARAQRWCRDSMCR